SSILPDQPTPFTDGARGVRFPGDSTRYTSPDNSFAQILEEDFILEAVVVFSGPVLAGLIARTKTSLGSSVDGWVLYFSSAGGGRVYLQCRKSNGGPTHYIALPHGSIYHIAAIKTSSGVTLLVNGVAGSTLAAEM